MEKFVFIIFVVRSQLKMLNFILDQVFIIILHEENALKTKFKRAGRNCYSDKSHRMSMYSARGTR